MKTKYKILILGMICLVLVLAIQIIPTETIIENDYPVTMDVVFVSAVGDNPDAWEQGASVGDNKPTLEIDLTSARKSALVNASITKPTIKPINCDATYCYFHLIQNEALFSKYFKVERGKEATEITSEVTRILNDVADFYITEQAKTSNTYDETDVVLE